jgi:trehalose 6-phosphate synthase
LVNRICAFDRLLTVHPSLKRALSLLQIATPSRGEIEAYEQLQAELAGLVTDVNGRHGEVDWTPIRYLSKGYGQNVLAGFYRSAQIGLVTPLQDGMNLVAKEYVAAQNPDDPGVLVLSRYAGAANELDAALIINPSDVEAIARAMHTALNMSILERRERWAAMMAKLKGHTIHQWFAEFVATLEETPSRRAFAGLEPALVPPASAAACGNVRVH